MSDGIKLTFDDREFQKALSQYVTATKKDVSEVVNHKARFICIGASIEAAKGGDVKRDQSLDSGLFNAIATGKTRLGVTKFGSAVKGKGNKKVAAKIYLSRVRAKGYSAFIWKKMAAQLGGRMSARAQAIKNADATKSVPSIRPVATLMITGLEQSHVTNVMQPALQVAINKEARDMVAYLDRAIAKSAKRHSGRKRR